MTAIVLEAAKLMKCKVNLILRVCHEGQVYGSVDKVLATHSAQMSQDGRTGFHHESGSTDFESIMKIN